MLRVSGKGAGKAFRMEAGGHRWQRVPPTERRGRVHTSTVTVAVLREPAETEIRIDDRDLDVSTTRGSGAGGQHRNKTDSCVIVKHLPSGLMVRCESERSQHQNRAIAMALLRARLWEAAEATRVGGERATRKAQVGSGMRGDKIRTIRVQDGQVTDHRTGQRFELRAYLRGEWEIA